LLEVQGSAVITSADDRSGLDALVSDVVFDADDPCLSFTSSNAGSQEARYTAIFPPGTEVLDDTIRLPSGGEIILGQVYSLSGGLETDVDELDDYLPSDCPRSTVW
jgi:hypothetical protein